MNNKINVYVYLSVMMLGLMVTRSVFDPTSSLYISEMGGILHLKDDNHREVEVE